MQELCNAARALGDALSALGSLDAWLGAVCPTTDLASAAKIALQDVYALFDAIKDPQNGFTGSKFGAASAVISTFNSFVLGAGLVVGGVSAAEITAAMGTAWVTMCRYSFLGGIAISKA